MLSNTCFINVTQYLQLPLGHKRKVVLNMQTKIQFFLAKKKIISQFTTLTSMSFMTNSTYQLQIPLKTHEFSFPRKILLYLPVKKEREREREES